jgi:5-methylcytosine-specific restriction endonuclease McrA
MAYYFAEANHSLKSAVWWKGTQIPGYDPKVWMRDSFGAVIKWSDHGNRDSKYGWEVDHIRPKRLLGHDDLSNLQPLHWENNVAKGDSYPYP